MGPDPVLSYPHRVRWLPLLGLLACQANEPLYLPTVEGARTMVLVVLADPPQIQVEDLKAGASGVPLVLDKQQTVVAPLLYFAARGARAHRRAVHLTELGSILEGTDRGLSLPSGRGGFLGARRRRGDR
jgi:hypothetical protein